MGEDWLQEADSRPLSGLRVELEDSVPWEELAATDADFLEENARVLGIPDADIDAGKEIVSAGLRTTLGLSPGRPGSPRFKDIDDESAFYEEKRERVRQGVIGRLQDWLAQRSYEVIAEESTRVRLPVFLLSAPLVKGCEATVTQTESTSAGGGLEFTVFGNGFTATRVFSVTLESALKVAAGDAEMAFVEVPVSIRKTKVVEAGRPKGIGIQCTVETEKRSRGAASVPDDELVPGAEVARFPLELASPNTVQSDEFGYEVRTEGSLSIGFKAFENDQTIKFEVARARGLTVGVVLAGGHCYIANRYARGPGVVWGFG